MTAVRVRDLGKRYGDVAAVRGVSLEVRHGEIVGLLGPNGAGKTTTLECLLGLRSPDAGEIEIEGTDVRQETAQIRARVGAVLQTTLLQDHLTPREALRLFAALHGQSRARAEELLVEFALTDKAGAAFETLSGGQRQRLALALAFIHAPRVLVLDEPTAGLDPAARRELHERIRARCDQGCAVLLSTHDMAEAQGLCDRVAIIDAGRIVALGTPDEVIARAGAASRLRVRTEPAVAEARIRSLPGVASCAAEAGALVITTTEPAHTLAGLTPLLAQEGCAVRELHLTPPTLEDAFLALTGKSLHNAEAAR